MNIPKNIASLINAMNVFEEEANKVRKEISEAMKKMTKLRILSEETDRLKDRLVKTLKELDPDNEKCVISNICIAEEPHGEEQFNGEWVLQHDGFEKGTYIGTYFYPIENSPYYVAVNYECKDTDDD